MKKIISIFTLVALVYSCTKKEAKIEIYLLQQNIQSSEGIPVIEYLKLKKMNSVIDSSKANQVNWNYDSIKKQYIQGGKFVVKNENLQTLPLIVDADILGLNLKKSELILSDNAKKRISNLKLGRNQFAICVNGEPVLTGYFRYNFSSVIYSWNYIGYNHNNENFQKIDTTFVIRQNPDYENWNPILTNLTDYPKLVKAFEETGRLKE